MIISTFGKIIRELRGDQKLSQEKLAELCNLDRTYISLLERGLRQPTLTTIVKLSDALEVSPAKLMELLKQKTDSNRNT